MAIDTSAIQEFSDAEMLKLYRWALATGAAGTTRSVAGRSITFPGVAEIRATIEWLEKRAASEAAGQEGMGILLAGFGEAR